MEDIIKTLISQSPALGGLIVVLVLGLRYMTSRDRIIAENMAEITKVFASTITNNATQCHNVQARSTDAIIKSTEIMAELRTTVHNMDLTLRNLNKQQPTS